MWGCFLSLCNVPLQDRDVGHSCPYPLQTTGGCSAGLGENLISGLLAHSQPSDASAKAVGHL